jgi:signal transduction histidine kinase
MARREGAGVMPRLPRVTAWPLAVKVPLLVAGLMVAVALVVSEVVLSRLARDQETNLNLLASAYLDGLSAAVLPAVVRADVWETFDALDRARGRYSGVKVRYALVELPDDTILAASDPLRFPVKTAAPEELRRKFANGDGLIADDTTGQAWLTRTLRTEGFSVGRILAEIDIADLLRVRRQVLLTLLLVNGGLALGFALIGYLAVKRMLQPLSVLARHVERIRDGRMEPVPRRYRRNVASEFAPLYDRFDAMACALSERETLASQLAEQEKYAMLGRLASGMAHEVNNPLGGMLNAIDTIQAHGDDPAVVQTSLEFLKRGLAGIRNVVRAALVTYKGGADAALLTPADLDDLPLLVQHETGVRRLRLDWRNRVEAPLAIDGPAVRQIVLNLLLNACAASPFGGLISVVAERTERELRIAVSDEGPGLLPELAALLEQADAGAPSRDSKGLGLWTTGHLVRRLGGRAVVERPQAGTRVSVTLPFGEEKTRHAA